MKARRARAEVILGRVRRVTFSSSPQLWEITYAGPGTKKTCVAVDFRFKSVSLQSNYYKRLHDVQSLESRAKITQ